MPAAPGERFAAQEHAAAEGGLEGGDGPQEGRLAGAVGTDQPQKLAGLHAQVDVVDGQKLAEADCQPLNRQQGGGRARCLCHRGTSVPPRLRRATVWRACKAARLGRVVERDPRR